MDIRIKTSLWVEAHVRSCFAADMPAFIVAKGDADRGGVVLKVNCFASGITVFEQSLDFDGNKIWRKTGVFDSSQERDVDASIAKKRNFDPDLWVIEIEDGRQNYEPDAPVSDI